MSQQQQKEQQRQCQSVPLGFETVKDQIKRNITEINPELEEVIDQIEDESDWEIFGIITGNNEMDELLFVYDGNEDVILHESVQDLKRCSAPCCF